MRRKLTAILVADVVGFSRLMGADEAGTLKAVVALQRDLLEPKAKQHDGRVVKTMGDGFLMEFNSVVDAVRYAVDVQTALAARDGGRPEGEHVMLRIGINLGDVIVQDDDIYGDGVNIASRLEGLAEPGGIVLSRAARDQVRDKIDLGMTDLGEIAVKNIARPVSAFSVDLDDRATALATPMMAVTKPKTASRYGIIIAACVLSLVLVSAAMVVWLNWFATESSDGPSLTHRPSIAVLPFDNLSQDPEQTYFTDGLTDDLITNLSLYSELLVISRNSTFRYRDQSVDTATIGSELGVAFVLDGSVRRNKDRLRVTVELVDAASGEQLWAERFDRELTDIFAVQDEITRSIAGRLLPEVTRASVRRTVDTPTESLRAWDLYLRARATQTDYTAAGQTEAIRLAQLAIEQDSQFAAPYALLARAQGLMFFNQWSGAPEDVLAEAIENARAAVRLDADNPAAYAALGYVYRLTGDDSQAIANLSRAAELNPNDANIRLELAHTLDWFRQQERALPEILEALRLSPRDQRLQVMFFYKAHILFHLGRYEESLAAADEMSGVINADFWQVFYHLVRAADFAQLGRSEEARSEIERARGINPGLSISAIERRFEGGNNHPGNRRAWLDALQLAGMPEE